MTLLVGVMDLLCVNGVERPLGRVRLMSAQEHASSFDPPRGEEAQMEPNVLRRSGSSEVRAIQPSDAAKVHPAI